jgi:hypothetical protein
MIKFNKGVVIRLNGKLKRLHTVLEQFGMWGIIIFFLVEIFGKKSDR